MHKNRTKYMVACPVVTPHIVEVIREARKILRGKMEAGISTPSFDYVTFGQPFVASYEEVSMISLGIDLSALRLSMGEHPFTLGEVKLFESKVLDTLYLEVNTDEDVTEFLKKMRDGLFSAGDTAMLGPRLDDGVPKLHITLFQGRGLLKRSGHLADRIESYNHSLRALKSTDQDHLVVFETFIPVVYARYIPEWKMLSSNPESP